MRSSITANHLDDLMVMHANYERLKKWFYEQSEEGKKLRETVEAEMSDGE